MPERKREASADTPLLEWIAGGAGALIFCLMVGVLVSVGLSGADAPPDIRIAVEEVTPLQGGYVLRFKARNEGDITAADVEIVARAGDGEGAEERRARFDYLPPHSERRGGFFFAGDPRAGALEIRAEGYNDP